MVYGDIYYTSVDFKDGSDGYKERYAIEMPFSSTDRMVLLSITSKYKNKSKHIKSQMFEIKDWQYANLLKESWVDANDMSGISLTLGESMQLARYTGQLSITDLSNFSQFLKEKKLL